MGEDLGGGRLIERAPSGEEVVEKLLGPHVHEAVASMGERADEFPIDSALDDGAKSLNEALKDGLIAPGDITGVGDVLDDDAGCVVGVDGRVGRAVWPDERREGRMVDCMACDPKDYLGPKVQNYPTNHN